MDVLKILWRVALVAALLIFFLFEAAFLYDLISGAHPVDPVAANIMLVALVVVLFFLGRWLLRRLKASNR